MSALRLRSSGPMLSIQDGGRFGFARFGVPRSGALDPVALRLANALVHNAPDEAGFEFRLQGPVLEAADGPVRLALGGAKAQLQRVDGARLDCAAWRSVGLNPGDVLTIAAPPNGGVGYLAIGGGLATDPVLGSRSRYARAGLGPAVGPGDTLPLRAAANPASDRTPDRAFARPPAFGAGPIRVTSGPQEHYFDAAALGRFFDHTHRVDKAVDRMGVRLKPDAPIHARPEYGHDIVSEGLVPGAIQIPGSGEPIILGVDCQTVGGYPKIATVIRADMHRVGQLAPGETLRFQSVSPTEAEAARTALETAIAAAERDIVVLRDSGDFDLNALYTENLIDGMVDARPDAP